MKKTKALKREEEVDDTLTEEVDGFIATNRYRTKFCVKEEDALQDCVLQKKGLYGCENYLQIYSKCKSKESAIELDELSKQREKEIDEFLLQERKGK
jgi:predicted nucleic acid binding AN1-type Zn finger protein